MKKPIDYLLLIQHQIKDYKISKRISRQTIKDLLGFIEGLSDIIRHELETREQSENNPEYMKLPEKCLKEFDPDRNS